MTATWFQGPARRFIEVSKEGFDRGVSILHFLGGFTCDVAATRAIAQTKMTINQRATVDGVARRRRLHGPLLRLPREARRPLGHRPPPADLRKRSARSRRSLRWPRSTRSMLARFPEGLRTSGTCSRATALRSRPFCRAAGAGRRAALRGGRRVARRARRPRENLPRAGGGSTMITVSEESSTRGPSAALS